MKVGQANALRLCLICGTPGAHLLTTKDGRAVRACEECTRSCHANDGMIDGATFGRAPIGREAEYVDPTVLELRP